MDWLIYIGGAVWAGLMIFIALRHMKKFSKSEPPEIHPDNVEHDDANAREVIAKAFNTGNIVFGNVDDDGNLVMTEIDSDDE